MDVKTVFLCLTLLVGSFAVPTAKSTRDLLNPMDSDLSIVGGDVAGTGSAPYMVALTVESNGSKFFVCGGSLVSTRTVLTAAHCMEDLSTLRGTVGTNKWNSGGQSYAFVRKVIHPHYDVMRMINDIALLITANEVALSNLVQPISLSYDVITENTPARGNGWGLLSYEKKTSTEDLMELHVDTVDGQQCAKEMAQRDKNLVIYPNLQLCALKATGYGMCQGDSGSPLVLLNASGAPKAQIGIVSWGFPCAVGAPDVFTRVSGYQDWLKQNIV